MSFFTDVFTIETWEQAKARGFTVSGFPPPTVTRGGYFKSTFDRVKVGDVLLCYVKAPAKRWVGAALSSGSSGGQAMREASNLDQKSVQAGLP